MCIRDRNRDARQRRCRDDAAPCRLAVGDGLGEVWIDQQGWNRRVVGIRVDDPVQELCADDAAAAPDRGDGALVEVPVVLLGAGDDDVEALRVGDDLRGVERGPVHAMVDARPETPGVGCIIRAQFLNRIVDAYANDPSIPSLLVDPYFAKAVADGEAAWRRGVSAAALSGIPVPGFSSALSYFDSLASERLPAALVQGQRDFFGAHTYNRVDEPGTFHKLWSADRSEIETESSSH